MQPCLRAQVLNRRGGKLLRGHARRRTSVPHAPFGGRESSSLRPEAVTQALLEVAPVSRVVLPLAQAVQACCWDPQQPPPVL